MYYTNQNKQTMENLREKIEGAVIRQELSCRGGGIEIDLTIWGYVDEKMTAYQNYLGGGILGAICNDCTIKDWESVITEKDDSKHENRNELLTIAEELRKYMYELTNPEDCWESQSFEENQNMPVSAY